MDVEMFEKILTNAVAGINDDIELILKIYEPLISRSSIIKGVFDEDLHQYILLHIVKNISKFEI